MKSRILLTSFTWENVKKQIWMPFMAFMILFLSFPIPLLMDIQSWSSPNYQGREPVVMEDLFLRAIFNNRILGIVVVALAIVIGVAGFSYLHSKKKSDFFLALPVKREQIHLMQMVLGILYFVIPLIIVYLISTLLGGMHGLLSIGVIKGILISFSFDLIIFLYAYLVTILAMQLSGRLFVGYLGILTLNTISIGVNFVVRGYCTTFFSTAKYMGDNTRFFYLSPVGALIQRFNLTSEIVFGEQQGKGDLLALGMILLLIVLGLGILTFYLSKIRKGEAAGRSISFKPIEVVIRIIITLIVGFAGGLLGYQMGYSAPFVWGIFGILIGTFLCNGLMETIFHMDFKKFFSKKIQVLVMAAFTLLTFFAFRGDWFGYDSYLPKQEKIKSVGFMINGVNYLGNYESPGISVKKGGSYLDINEFYEKGMNLPCTNETYTFLQKVVELQLDYKNSTMEGQENKVVATESIGATSIKAKTAAGASVHVAYHLTNGKTENRIYYVSVEGMEEAFLALTNTREYLEAFYPVLHLNEADINAYTLEADSLRLNDNSVTKDGTNYINGGIKDAISLLEAYKKDLRNLKGEEILYETPIGSLTFKNERINYGNIYDSGETPIYASFKNTFAWFEEKGISLTYPKEINHVKRIVIYDYRAQKKSDGYETQEVKEYVFTDPKEIDAIMPYLKAYKWKSVFMKQFEVVNTYVELRYNDYKQGGVDYYVNSEGILQVISQLRGEAFNQALGE